MTLTETPPELYAFCIDTHDSLKRSLAEQAKLLKELGYQGVGHLWLDQLGQRVESIQSSALKLYQVTLLTSVDIGQVPYDPRLPEMLSLLRGRGVQLAVLMNGREPSDESADARAVELLRELSVMSEAAEVEIVLYPHAGLWLETPEDAYRVAEKVGRNNVNVMFNLCHWLRMSKSRDYPALFRKIMPRLKAVSINGADSYDTSADWSRYIQPLGRGSFDVQTLVRMLGMMGYQGAVGLQCYGIPGDARDHLQESMKAWKGQWISRS